MFEIAAWRTGAVAHAWPGGAVQSRKPPMRCRCRLRRLFGNLEQRETSADSPGDKASCGRPSTGHAVAGDSQVVDSSFPTDPAAARSDALRMPDVRARNSLNPVSFAGTPIHAPMLARNLLMQV